MEKNFLVLGATGGIGYAFTKELIQNGIKPDILVRNKDKAEILFGKKSGLNIIEGDVNDLKLLQVISKEKSYIFCGINVPYNKWHEQMRPVVQNVIKAASQNKATILFPENNYAYGNISNPITEDISPVPQTKKGKLRLELVNMLKKAAYEQKIKTIILRLPDFFGPNVTNELIKMIFKQAAQNKAVKWLINARIPHQFAYTPNAAKYFCRLTDKELPDFFLANYGGFVVPNMEIFAKEIAAIQNMPARHVKVTPKFILQIIAFFNPIVRELKENFYQFENFIFLDDTKLRLMLPQIDETDFKTALKETLDWYKKYIEHIE